MSSITITEKRLESVTFAQPYYDSDQSLTVTKASGIKSLDGMDGKIVGVDTGSTGDIWSTANKAKYGFGEISRFEGLAPGDARPRGRPHRRLYLRHSGAALLRQGQAAVRSRRADPETAEQYSVMFAKDAPLAAKVNDAITTMKKEGFLAKLHQTWFGTAARRGTTTTARSSTCRS